MVNREPASKKDPQPRQNPALIVKAVFPKGKNSLAFAKPPVVPGSIGRNGEHKSV
jgi:hypothetical protein